MDPAVRYTQDEPRLHLASDDLPMVRLLDLLWRGRWTVSALAGAGLAIALLLVLFLPKRYTAVTTFTVETQGSGLGSMGGLGALAGLAGQLGANLPSMTTVSPDYFVAVIRSRSVRDALLDTRFSPRGEIVASGGATLLELLPVGGAEGAARREKAQRLLAKRVVADVDRRTSVVSVSVTDRDPERAASIARRTIELVNWYNVEKRQSRSRQQREFSQRRLAEAQGELRAAEEALEQFLARNRTWQMSPMLTLDHARLMRVVEQKQGVVTTLASSYEEARIAEAGDLPAVSVLDAAQVPVKRSFPRPTVFLPLGLLLGLAAGIALVVARPAARGWSRLAERRPFAG